MPLIQSAKKKLRQDKKRTQRNTGIKRKYKEAIKMALQNKSNQATQKKAYAHIDKAAKKGIIHKNKAARLKSRVARRK